MFSIRTATRADGTEIEALLGRSYPALLTEHYSQSVLEAALPVMIKAQPALLGCGTYFMAETRGALVAVGGWTRERPGSGEVCDGRGHVRHVATDPLALRRGAARALMEEICETARAAGMTALDCLSTLGAVPFYRAMGFAPGRKVTVPMGESCSFPAVEMVREL